MYTCVQNEWNNRRHTRTHVHLSQWAKNSIKRLVVSTLRQEDTIETVTSVIAILHIVLNDSPVVSPVTWSGVVQVSSE